MSESSARLAQSNQQSFEQILIRFQTVKHVVSKC